MENKRFKHLFGSVYVVENQNGFNNALYNEFDARDEPIASLFSKKQVRDMVQNYPKKYPSAINIIDNTFECARIQIEIIELKILLKKLKIYENGNKEK